MPTTVLALDIGSSSIKAAILRRGRPVGEIARVSYPTARSGNRAEVDPQQLLRAVKRAISMLPSRKSVDVLAFSVMSSAWIAMDGKGKPLTPIFTHQDRRSVEDARALIHEFGEEKLLSITGSLPFPGGISSTSQRWAFRNIPSLKKRAALVGPLNTFIHRVLTGARVTDPGNASFTGVYRTLPPPLPLVRKREMAGVRGEQRGAAPTATSARRSAALAPALSPEYEGEGAQRCWSDELLAACGSRESLMPGVLEGDAIAGTITKDAARNFGLKAGLPVLTGVIDTSAAMALAGAQEGRLLHVCGTSDVLAVCTQAPCPHPRLLTRALGFGGLFLIAATLASAGSTIDWTRDTFFADLDDRAFLRLVKRAAAMGGPAFIRFDPYLAGERTCIEQRTASLTGLSLDTGRTTILREILASLARASTDRFPLLMGRRRILRDVLVSGGAGKILAPLFHADLPRHLRYRYVDEATVLGLWHLAQRVR
jgi:sugar (pentulose or hexulose) kinase